MKEEWHQLVHGSIILFTHKGIRATSVDEITRFCQLPTQSFYEHFDSKEKLVCHIITKWLEKTERYLSFNRHLSPNAITEISNFFRAAEKMVEIIQPIFFIDICNHYSNIWEKLEQLREETIASFIRLNVCRGLQEGLYRRNLDQSLMEKIYFTPMQIVTEHRHIERCLVNRIYHEMNTIFLHGLVNLRGMKLIYEKDAH
ncbi:TetR/AcrR family transcriptional regulator [Chitinophaga flava]|uniref:HTH tetR-type domain-containing protein n=1 Tax=Chitinophaga flava TaxID=2259036 RepID=A0A365XSV8_9BACT|nr:TetR/AcrR family transcriptional regulator [Chitinophaga flava]RBL89091.1 hypothetical protein DF182_21370 [Chitinophaga flava]